MKLFVKILDICMFTLFIVPALAAAAITVFAMSFFCRKKSVAGGVNRFSFAISDLISNKNEDLSEDILLSGYIKNDFYVYLDYASGADRYEKLGERVFFYSIAAHPAGGLYSAGFRLVNMILVELKMLARAFSIISENDIHIVKAHDPHLLGLNALIMSRIFRIPFILHLNSDFEMKYRGTGKVSTAVFASRSLERAFESCIMASADLIMADRSSYGRSLNFPKRCLARYRVFGIRVDGRHYADPSSRRDMRALLGLGSRKAVLYVGRLHPVKHPEDTVKALSLIRKSLKDVALLVVGSGMMRSRMEEIARQEGLENNVFFLGSRTGEELKDIFRTADLLLAPHGGVTLVEAALAGTPIVAYDFDWHSEFVEDGKMGYVVPFLDFESMAKKSLDILSDDGRRRAMGDYCRREAVSRYPRQRSIENEKRVYDEALGRV